MSALTKRDKGPGEVAVGFCRWLVVIGVLGLVFGIGPNGWAQAANQQSGQERPTVVPQTQPEAQQVTDAKVPMIDRALTLADFAGMEPRPELKDKLTQLTSFIQNQPTDGAPATEDTEVWLARTNSALYVVFICFDRHPELIRSHLARRENITKDDYVTLMLDPFQDRLRGVEFQVNPAGVQADASWTESNGPDYRDRKSVV